MQMPVTPGASGSPVIADSNMAVGVISEVPVIITNDVVQIAQAFGNLQNRSSNVSLSGFDVTKIVGELAWTVQQFESPGAGLAVPTSRFHGSQPAKQAPKKQEPTSHQKRETASPRSR